MASTSTNFFPKTALFFNARMPDEAGIAAICNYLIGNNIEIVSSSFQENPIEKLKRNLKNYEKFYIIGTYWNPYFVNLFDNKNHEPRHPNLYTVIWTKEGQNIIDLVKLLSPDNISSDRQQSISTFFDSHELIVKSIQYFCNKNIDTQSFFNGIYQLDGDSLFDSFMEVFNSKKSFSEIAELGDLATKITKKIAYNRVKNNAVSFERNDIQIAMCNATELINLTHDALFERFQKIDLSVVFYTFYSDGNEIFKISYRSYSPEKINAYELAKKTDGGGQSSIAGTSILQDMEKTISTILAENIKE